jgi:fructoselysine-6-P-deglycase FrlB-like protein
MRSNVRKMPPGKLQVLIAGARTIYFAGGSCGVGEELALKFCELGKKKARFIPGTQILHGPEEVIERGDVIFLLFADKYKEYFDRFALLKEKTGAYIFSIGEKAPFSDIDLPIDLLKNYKPYCILAYFWNILTAFAKTKGFSLDKGDKISKVGVSI